MPKLKTKSSAKKRFKITANGLIKAAFGCKQHFLRRRKTSMKRSSRGMQVLSSSEFKSIKSYIRV